MALAVVWGTGEWAAKGQATTELLTTQLPYPAYEPVKDDHYLMRLGRLRMNLRASFRVEYTDNASLSSQVALDEWIMGPLLTAGFFLPISEYQTFQMDVGVGYDYYSRRDGRFRLNIVPNSHLHYAFEVGDVRFMVANTSATQSDATQQISIPGSGVGGNVVEFNQLQNDSNLRATYAASSRLSFSTGYSYVITRSLTDSFGNLDRNIHAFNGGPMWQINHPWAVGLRASYSIFSYLERIQNDGQSWSAGPHFIWRPTDFWTVRGGVSMTETTFDQTGISRDTSGFSAPTFDIGVDYQMNKWMSHSLTADRSAGSGFTGGALDSNFADTFTINYMMRTQVGPKLAPVLHFTYADATMSGQFGLDAKHYAVGLGIGYPFAQRLSGGFEYSYSIRDSQTAGFAFNAHRVSMSLNYLF